MSKSTRLIYRNTTSKTQWNITKLCVYVMGSSLFVECEFGKLNIHGTWRCCQWRWWFIIDTIIKIHVAALSQWDTYYVAVNRLNLVKIVACCLFDTKLSSESVLCLYQLDHGNKLQWIPDQHIKIPCVKYQPFCLGFNVLDYHQTSNISHTMVGNKIVDHSDVVGTLPVGAAPTISLFST